MKILVDEGYHVLVVTHYGKIHLNGPFKSMRAATIFGNNWSRHESSLDKWEIINNPEVVIAKTS